MSCEAEHRRCSSRTGSDRWSSYLRPLWRSAALVVIGSFCPECRRIFLICIPCLRRRIYCSDACASMARRESSREANRRHQQSEEGRADHRDRQAAYRTRHGVTDHRSGKLAIEGRVRPGDARATDHRHDSDPAWPDDLAAHARPEREGDRPAGQRARHPSVGPGDAARRAFSLVPNDASRCAHCGQRADRGGLDWSTALALDFARFTSKSSRSAPAPILSPSWARSRFTTRAAWAAF